MSEINRPTTVPEAARWQKQDNEWEMGFFDEKEVRQGGFMYWRADGTLVNQCFS